MNLIDIKERIAIDEYSQWTVEERDYILRAINRSEMIDRIRRFAEEHNPLVTALTLLDRLDGQ